MASEVADERGAGEGDGPSLSLPAFTGSLSLLLSLARAQQIDLAQLSLPDLLDQLSPALAQARPATSLGEKGSWLVMAAWLVLLRSRLLLPADTAAQLAAEADARTAARPSASTCGRRRHSPAGWRTGRSSARTCSPAASPN